MIPLSNLTLGSLPGRVVIPAYDRSAITPGIVHIGVGNFHRVHQAPIIDDCLAAPDGTTWGICGVSLTDGPDARRKAEAYHRQDNLYTIVELTRTRPRPVRIIGAMVEYLHAPTDPLAVVRRLADPLTRIVSMTMTEGGYNVDNKTGEFDLAAPDIVSDLAGDLPPRTAFGLIVAALAERRRNGLPPFTVMSCDNLRRNGDTSRAGVVGFARAKDADLARWIDGEGAFPNSMVDRIAPQVKQGDREAIVAESEIEDALPATYETYTSWVIEDRFSAGRPPLEIGGVEFRDDVAKFVEVKGRLSNAAHMLMCYPSILLGNRFVHEGMSDPRIERLLRNFWDIDAFRLVDPPAGYSMQQFVDKVVQRFADPVINDQLLRVAHGGTDKINVFHGKTIRALVDEGADVTREAFLLAAFRRYLGGVDDKGGRFEVAEPGLTAAERRSIADGEPLALLSTAAFAGLRLQDSSVFSSRYVELARKLDDIGCAATLAEILV